MIKNFKKFESKKDIDPYGEEIWEDLDGIRVRENEEIIESCINELVPLAQEIMMEIQDGRLHMQDGGQRHNAYEDIFEKVINIVYGNEGIAYINRHWYD